MLLLAYCSKQSTGLLGLAPDTAIISALASEGFRISKILSSTEWLGELPLFFRGCIGRITVVIFNNQ